MQSIDPSRTVIRAEDGSPVYISNSDVLNYLVKCAGGCYLHGCYFNLNPDPSSTVWSLNLVDVLQEWTHGPCKNKRRISLFHIRRNLSQAKLAEKHPAH